MMISTSSPPLAFALLVALTPAVGAAQPAGVNVPPPLPSAAAPGPAPAPAPGPASVPAATAPKATNPAEAAPPAGAPPPAPPQPAVLGTPPAAGVGGGDNVNITQLEGFLEPFIYDIVNRRDPFVPYAEFVPKAEGVEDTGPQRALSPAQRWDLDQLKLIGIMWDIKDPKAMFLDPEQDVMILGRDESVGNRNGYVATIREGEVVVVEALRKKGDIVYRTKVLRIER